MSVCKTLGLLAIVSGFGCFTASTAHAALMTYDVDAAFQDGGSLQGSFQSDGVSQTPTAFTLNLADAGGPVATYSSFSYQFADFVTILTPSGPVGEFDTFAFAPWRNADISIFFALPGTPDAGAINTGLVNGFGSSQIIVNDGATLRLTGTVTLEGATVSAVPVPATVSLFLTAMLALSGVAYSKSRGDQSL